MEKAHTSLDKKMNICRWEILLFFKKLVDNLNIATFTGLCFIVWEHLAHACKISPLKPIVSVHDFSSSSASFWHPQLTLENARSLLFSSTTIKVQPLHIKSAAEFRRPKEKRERKFGCWNLDKNNDLLQSGYQLNRRLVRLICRYNWWLTMSHLQLLN